MTYIQNMTFVEYAGFSKKVAILLDEDSLIALEVELLQRPESGALIVNGGGLRKIRWAAMGRGKSGGVRVIYYVRTAKGQILLVDIYAKNEKENLSKAELAKLRKEVGI